MCMLHSGYRLNCAFLRGLLDRVLLQLTRGDSAAPLALTGPGTGPQPVRVSSPPVQYTSLGTWLQKSGYYSLLTKYVK